MPSISLLFLSNEMLVLRQGFIDGVLTPLVQMIPQAISQQIQG